MKKSLTAKDLRKIKYQVYRTPSWVYNILYDKFPKQFKGKIIDPSAGDSRMILELINRGNTNKHHIIDIRKEELKTWKNNKNLDKFKFQIANFLYLDDPKLPKYRCAITNPPFKEATQFVDKLHNWVKPGGWIWILQRCDWLASKSRSLWHEKHKSFSKVMILSKRPTWELDNKKDNSSDTRDYAWFGYQVGSVNKGPVVGWLFEKEKENDVVRSKSGKFASSAHKNSTSVKNTSAKQLKKAKAKKLPKKTK